MEISSLKLKLIHQILQTNSEELLQKVGSLLKEDKQDFWDELTEEQKKEVDLGLKQIENGETIDFDEFLIGNKCEPEFS